MGMYDSYQLANSHGIKQYVGSTVPELVQVSEQLQQRYDKAADAQDNMSNFLSSVPVAPQDQAAYNDFAQGYRDRIKKLSGRPDLENTLRETSQLARRLPEEYAPFAQRMKDMQEYQEKLSKDDKINPGTKHNLMAMSLAQDPGIHKDQNGRYTGRFQGADYVKDLNVDEKVDKWIEHAKPVVTGDSYEKIGDQWLVKNGNKTTVMDPKRLAAIIKSGADNDQEYQSYVTQQQRLGTYNIDHSKTDPSVLDEDTPTNNAVKKLMGNGLTMTDAVRTLKAHSIGQEMLGNAMQYGVNKYTQHDRETSLDYSANPYGVQREGKKLDNEGIPIAATILQPTVGSTLDHPDKMAAKITETGKASKDQYTQYLAWSNLNGVKASGSPYADGTKWYDKNGTEVTSEARRYIDAQVQASKMQDELIKKDKAAMDRANFVITKDLKDKAQAAYDKAYSSKLAQRGGAGAAAAGGISEEEAKTDGRLAFESVIQNTPGYQRYKSILKEDAAGNSVPVGISTFKNIKLNKAVEETFNNLSTNLDNAGLKYGAQGLEWASGQNTGTQLSSDDYKKVIGDAKFAGVGIDTDGQYKMFFKVGSAKVDAKGKPVGEDILVKMPAYSGMAENLVKEKQIAPAHQYLAQSLGQLQSAPNKEIMLPLGDNLKVKVKEILPSEKSHYERNPGANYIITYFGNGGKEKAVTANSIDDAVSHIIESMQKAN